MSGGRQTEQRSKKKKKQAEWIVTTRERWECVKSKQVNENAANRSLLILNSFSNQFLVILRFQSKQVRFLGNFPYIIRNCVCLFVFDFSTIFFLLFFFASQPIRERFRSCYLNRFFFFLCIHFPFSLSLSAPLSISIRVSYCFFFLLMFFKWKLIQNYSK